MIGSSYAIDDGVTHRRYEKMIDLHAEDVESDEEPPGLTDSDDDDDDGIDYIPDDALGRKVHSLYPLLSVSLV